MADTYALKYRPKTLEAVVGQTQVIDTLRGMLANADKVLPNALMLTGPSGVGKTTLSRMVARYLNCETGDSCGKCESCTEFDQGLSQDYKEVNASDSGGIDDIRALVRSARFKPRRKVRVIHLDECHRLSSPAANSLLKPLEEPPENTLWILATTDPQKIPNFKAVMGRCTQLFLGLPEQKDIVRRIKWVAKQEGLTWLKSKSAKSIAEVSGGHVRDALQLLESMANAVASKGLKGSDLQDFINDQSLTSEDVELDKAALTVLDGVYAKEPERVVKGVLDAGNAVTLAHKLLYANQYLLINQTVGKHRSVWPSPLNKGLVRMLDIQGMPKVKTINKVQGRLLDVLAELMAFPANPDMVLMVRLNA